MYVDLLQYEKPMTCCLANVSSPARVANGAPAEVSWPMSQRETHAVSGSPNRAKNAAGVLRIPSCFNNSSQIPPNLIFFHNGGQYFRFRELLGKNATQNVLKQLPLSQGFSADKPHPLPKKGQQHLHPKSCLEDGLSLSELSDAGGNLLRGHWIEKICLIFKTQIIPNPSLPP